MGRSPMKLIGFEFFYNSSKFINMKIRVISVENYQSVFKPIEYDEQIIYTIKEVKP